MSGQLDEIERKLDLHIARNEKVIERLEELTGTHHKTLFGTNGQPGHDKKLDRLEQSEKTRAAILGALGTGVVGLAANALWNWVKGH